MNCQSAAPREAPRARDPIPTPRARVPPTPRLRLPGSGAATGRPRPMLRRTSRRPVVAIAGPWPASASANSRRGREPVRRQLLQRASTAASTCGGIVFRCSVSDARLLRHHPRDDRLRRRPRERRLRRQHLVEHAAQRVDVGLGRDPPARPSPARGSCSAACRALIPVSVIRVPPSERRPPARCRSPPPSRARRGAGCSPA